MIPSKTTKPRRISIKDTVAHLELPDAKSLFKIRAACRSGALPCTFPTLGLSGFLESDIVAFKKLLDAIVATVGKTQPTNSSPADRRANSDRRGNNRG